MLPKIYIIAFCIGPVYFLLSFLLSYVVGQEFNESSGDINDFDELELELNDLTSIDSLSDDIDLEISEIELNDIENTASLKLNYFSPKIWVAIITGFGFGGYFSIEVLDKTGTISLLFASMAGLLIGTFLFSIISYLYTHTSKNDIPLKIVGQKGLVTLSIPHNKIGLVRIEYDSGNQEFRATSNQKRTLQSGEEVKVIKYIPKRHLLIVKKNK